MLDEYSSLRPFKNAANILANKKDWPHLYSKEKLRENQVPIAAAVYTNDMYVDREFSMDLARIIPNINVWEDLCYPRQVPTRKINSTLIFIKP